MNNDKATLKISAAKGRPMLTWVGKRPLTQVTAFPAQYVEAFDPDSQFAATPSDSHIWKEWPSQYPKGGLFFHGDNKECMAHMLTSGFRRSVNLVYIDPPFDSAADYVRKVTLRGSLGNAKVDGETYSLGEQIQYTDIWANDNYLQFMYERLCLLKELLADDGSIFVHCDNRKMHLLRCILDEVFGPESFVNEIVWVHQIMGGAHDMRFPKAHETIFWYANGRGRRLNSEDKNVRVPFSEYVVKTLKQDEDGRSYYERRRMSRKATDAELKSRAHTRTYVDDVDAGTVATDVWLDMLSYQEPPDEREGLDLYPTQKTTRLLTRIISAASKPGDLVMDAFAGSGVVCKVAQRLGRRWIGCDVNKGAIQTASKRIQVLVTSHIGKQSAQESLDIGDASKDALPPPVQLGFSIWRVNDYDLQLQHNEAVNLACEHVGIERKKADNFFDGTLGKNLAKIIPFSHPLSPLDLEEIKRELDARPDEDRNIQVVCLGEELASKAWIEDWNRLRTGKNAVNKISVIELRTDTKYGKFFQHQPDTADISFSRDGDTVIIEITDFLSPTIIERLQQQAGIVQPKIDDWRSMVDCIMIDADYNGQVFRIDESDIPEKKTDLVQGTYQIPIVNEGGTIAVKVIDMLGEEIIVTEAVSAIKKRSVRLESQAIAD